MAQCAVPRATRYVAAVVHLELVDCVEIWRAPLQEVQQSELAVRLHFVVEQTRAHDEHEAPVTLELRAKLEQPVEIVSRRARESSANPGAVRRRCSHSRTEDTILPWRVRRCEKQVAVMVVRHDATFPHLAEQRPVDEAGAQARPAEHTYHVLHHQLQRFLAPGWWGVAGVCDLLADSY
jgi:hypothetical protein